MANYPTIPVEVLQNGHFLLLIAFMYQQANPSASEKDCALYANAWYKAAWPYILPET